MARRRQSLFTPRDRPRADRDSFLKLDPRTLVAQPGHLHRRARQRDHDGDLRHRRRSRRTRQEPLWFTGVIAVWLWMTVLFANFAEAMAEGRGKAQANALRATRTTTIARRRLESGALEDVPAPELQRGDVVVVERRRGHPCRRRDHRGRRLGRRVGDHRRVGAGRSARPAATARRSRAARACSPTGSSIEVTQEPGKSFLDRMIALVEGAERRKTPNEIALNILLAGLTITFLVAAVTLQPVRRSMPAPTSR